MKYKIFRNNNHYRKIFFLIIIMLCNFQLSQEIFAKSEKIEITIDLSKSDAGSEVTEQIDMKNEAELLFTITSLLPSKKYEISIGTLKDTIPQFITSLNKIATECSPSFEAAKINLFNLENEKQIPAVIANFDKVIEDYCQNSTIKSKYRDSIKLMTEYSVFPNGIKINQGEELKLTISRKGTKNGEQPRTWTYIYKAVDNSSELSSGSSESNWKLSYGFAFPIYISKDEEYFSKVSKAFPNKFVITQKTNNTITKFIPAIFISWQPKQNLESDWTNSITGGLGFDFENPTIFAGGSFTYNNNLSFVYGIIAHKLVRLNGKYNVGEIISENLDFEQLHEKVYRINIFVALSFRFSDNPF